MESGTEKSDAFVLDMRDEELTWATVNDALFGLKLVAAGVLLGIALGILAIEWL